MKKVRLLFLFSCLLICEWISAQDVIYRKNGEVIQARIIDKTNRYYTYQHYDQVDTLKNFISTAIVDSVRYQDGRRDVFGNKSEGIPQNDLKPVGLYNNGMEIGHHLLGFDVLGLLYNNLRFSYEFLPGKAHVGFRAVYSKNFNPGTTWVYDYGDNNDPYYGNINLWTKWHGLAGVNYYFLPPRTFRVGTGLHYCFGSCRFGRMIYNENTNVNTEVFENRNLRGVIWSFLLYQKFSKNPAMNFGIDVPLHVDPSFSVVMFRGEILINF
jgi:hypothetical protein